MYKLLVVDDEADILFFLKSYFQTKDFEVSTAQSGEEAIEKVKEIRPHIVLMDIIMPGMGGLEALKKIKEIDPAIGVIMATAVLDNSAAEQAIAAGAYDYVSKPFDLKYLETTVLIKLIKMIG
ncbi:MAG: response regulator [Deltaproteobacteria bacterium]|nr:response regulator [Deltaproteobacteria bacterium]